MNRCNNSIFSILITSALIIFSVSNTVDADALPIPDIEVGPLSHNYSHIYGHYYDPETGMDQMVIEYTNVRDRWTLYENGVSFTVESAPSEWYDQITVRFTAGTGKKFVVDAPDGVDVGLHVGIWFSTANASFQPPFEDHMFMWHYEEDLLSPAYQNITLLGPSGETVMSFNYPFFEPWGISNEGDSIFAYLGLSLPDNLEFSTIELTCRYNDTELMSSWGQEYTLRPLWTDISFDYGGDGVFPDLGPAVTIVPEPVTILLVGLGGLLVHRRRNK